MPNHVHLIVVPQSAESLRRAIGEAHRRYTRRINVREGWRGHLWQGRFASFVMDEDHLLTAAQYVELNPVRAGLVQAPSCYRWSSAAAHLRGRDVWPRQGQPCRVPAPPSISSILPVARARRARSVPSVRAWGKSNRSTRPLAHDTGGNASGSRAPLPGCSAASGQRRGE
ncbi:MAG: transposase [Isosphaeraceae bacterium]